MPRNRLTRAGSAGAARAIRFDGASARPGYCRDRHPAEAVARPLDPARLGDVATRRSPRRRRARRAAPGASGGRARDRRRRSVSHSGMLDVQRMLEDVAGVDEGVADLEDRMADAMARAPAAAGGPERARRRPRTPRRGRRRPARPRRAEPCARRRRLRPRVRHRLGRREHPPARVRGLERVRPGARDEAAEVVPVEMRGDQEVGLGGDGPCRSRRGQIAISGPEPASTSTVRPWPRRTRTLTGPS